VVSVGSLSAGGAGKTPFVIALAKLLKGSGLNVDVLSRGYGRLDRGPARVDPAGSAEAFGDEPILIAREALVQVYVGARRVEAGRLAESAGGRVGVHLLDDGFQHRQLAREINIALVSSEDLQDWLLPMGNLREPLGALKRATVFAVPNGDEAAVIRLRALGLKQPVWRFWREMELPKADGPVYAFCGIARPEQFFSGLERAGLRLVGRKAFRDHSFYRASDVRVLEQFADRLGATALVTTEKDRVRIGELAKYLGQTPLLTAGLRIVIQDEATLAEWFVERLGLQ